MIIESSADRGEKYKQLIQQPLPGGMEQTGRQLSSLHYRLHAKAAALAGRRAGLGCWLPGTALPERGFGEDRIQGLD